MRTLHVHPMALLTSDSTPARVMVTASGGPGSLTLCRVRVPMPAVARGVASWRCLMARMVASGVEADRARRELSKVNFGTPSFHALVHDREAF